MEALTEKITHTPGPWEQFAPNIKGVVEQDYRTISAGENHRRAGFEITGFISEADAKLIAAAPDLLRALKGLSDYFAFMVKDPQFHEYTEAIAAIKKATE